MWIMQWSSPLVLVLQIKTSNTFTKYLIEQFVQKCKDTIASQGSQVIPFDWQYIKAIPGIMIKIPDTVWFIGQEAIICVNIEA